MRVLVTGGLGYIGAICARELAGNHEVLVYDHLESHRKNKLELDIVKGDILDASKLDKVLHSFKPDVVMHFAAYIQMGESVRDPRKYYENNVAGSITLIESMLSHNINKIVFASSAGVYGNPVHLPIKEADPKEPTNPYGETKLVVERLLKWYDIAYSLRSVSIRFFNAAGATLDGQLGEDHHDESHIIPNIINAQLGDREFTLFGNDYPTPDGTCVRDYIHVVDLANAFILSAEKLMSGGTTTAYNAGTGKGYSNLEIIKMVEKVASDYAQTGSELAEGLKLKVKYVPRRPGDASELVADVARIKADLGWEPKYSDLETIVRSAYAWHQH